MRFDLRGRGKLRHLLPLLAPGLLLAACAGPNYGRGGSAHYSSPHPIYKVGAPYQVDGVWYYPRVDYSYDKTGVASWYGEQFEGRYTANGEVFDLNRLTAAHRTLPMPSVVEVTNLQNGRSLRLRVNDRGPFADGRIIDVSRRAAQLLGFETAGTAEVRVRILPVQSIAAAEAVMQTAGQDPEILAATAPPELLPVIQEAAAQLQTINRPAATPPVQQAAVQPALAPAPAAPQQAVPQPTAPAPVQEAAMPQPMFQPRPMAPAARPETVQQPMMQRQAAPAPVIQEAQVQPPMVRQQIIQQPTVRPSMEPAPVIQEAAVRPVTQQSAMQRYPEQASMAGRPVMREPSPRQLAMQEPVALGRRARAEDGAGPVFGTLHLPVRRVRRIFIQAGSFSRPDYAVRVSSEIASLGKVVIVTTSDRGYPVYRVCIGPVASDREAEDLLVRLVGSGYSQAQIVEN